MIASEVKQYGSESCHFYTRSGEPMHQVPYKDKKRVGELRDTNITDAREMGLLPSVSGILGVMGKPGLDNWKRDQIISAAWDSIDFTLRSDLLTQEDEEDFRKAVIQAAEQKMTRARDLGTEIHGAIAQYLINYRESDGLYEGQWMQKAHAPFVGAAVAALKELGVWEQPFESEKTFASVLGFGGTIDYKTDGLIADFKCVDRLDKKLDYPDRVSQLTGYCMGAGNFYLGLENTRLVNIFISTSNPGEYLIREYTTEEKERGFRLFMACFELWKIANNYDPLLR